MNDLTPRRREEQTRRILIIEDDAAIASVYCDKFAREGFHVSHAHDGEEGLHMAESLRPDIILLDLKLPKMDGFEVLKRLKEHAATLIIPVIVWTNMSDEGDKQRAQSFGILDYLVKVNFIPSEVVERVKTHLRVTPSSK